MHCITERIAAMSYPADGLESAFKNHIDDISATIESKHSNKVCVKIFFNFCIYIFRKIQKVLMSKYDYNNFST